jgi:large subunit ribosomal protein L5
MAEDRNTGEPAANPASGGQPGAVKPGAAGAGGGPAAPEKAGEGRQARRPASGAKAGGAGPGAGEARQGAKPAKEGGAKPAKEGGAKPAREGGGRQPAKEGGGRQKAAEGKGKAEKAPKLPVKEPRLRILYREKVAKALREEFGYSSVQQVPRLEKIVVSMGVGEAIANKKLLEAAVKELAQITGLKPVRTKAKKSIANFKVRKGMEIGAMVTLRGYHMYEFLDRLTNVALPRVKDFRGTNPNAFDGRGNYALGLAEQIIFPEIDYDKIERVSGMNIAICTSARTDREARQLLAGLGMPFRK